MTIEMTRPRTFAVTRLIGIGGKLRSGKDTVADYLVEKHGWVKLGMSDPLDVALRRENPWVRIEPGEPSNSGKRVKWMLYFDLRAKMDYVTAKQISDVRRLLQGLGTEVGRNLIGENTWVNVADNMIYDLLSEGKKVIITGVRFPNEIAMIGKYEVGQAWYVQRDVETSADHAAHASETSVSAEDFSVVIDNRGTLEELYKTVDTLLAGG
jgi:hypothetical protein